MTREIHKKIYSVIATLLDYEAMPRSAVIDKALKHTMKCINKDDVCAVGTVTEMRGNIGTVLDELVEHGLVGVGAEGYYLISQKPVILRAEACEREILKLLRSEPMTKANLRARLEMSFGTNKTISLKDDNILHSLIGNVLSRLTKTGILQLSNGTYRISDEKSARLDDIDQMLAVKGEFLSRLHSRGGEFFEHFFMTLLGKYLSRLGKTVEMNEVKGGAADGGIDGIIITVDPLGFRETIMVQMKNRIEDTTETTVRGFWGSVCAFRGSRGIFATTSGFHPSAITFLSAIDNCVGIDGDRIFKMACECQYGVKRKKGKLTVDTKIL